MAFCIVCFICFAAFLRSHAFVMTGTLLRFSTLSVWFLLIYHIHECRFLFGLCFLYFPGGCQPCMLTLKRPVLIHEVFYSALHLLPQMCCYLYSHLILFLYVLPGLLFFMPFVPILLVSVDVSTRPRSLARLVCFSAHGINMVIKQCHQNFASHFALRVAKFYPFPARAHVAWSIYLSTTLS